MEAPRTKTARIIESPFIHVKWKQTAIRGFVDEDS
jgi:hypothetical protein